jgi:hypothetical protein
MHNPRTARSYAQLGRARMGCLGSLVLAFAVAVGVVLLLFPWAFNIGGCFTLLNVWTGYGRLHSSTGATYGLYARLMLPGRGGRAGNSRSNNLVGNALLCTPQGLTYAYDLSGSIHHVWLSTEGKDTDLYLYTPKGEKINCRFDLHGVWRDGQLVLDDRGSMSHAFEANGTLAPKGWPTRAPSPGEHAAITLAYGSKEEFDTLCKSQVFGSR